MTFEWSAIWSAWPALMIGAWMTIKITSLGLIGGTIIGALSGVIVTYVPVPMNKRNVVFVVLAFVVLYLISLLFSWLSSIYVAPTWLWLALKLLVLAVLIWRFSSFVPLVLSIIAQVYILLMRGTPIVVQVMFIYFALP